MKNIACALNLFRIQIYGRPNQKALLRAKSPFVCKHLLFDTQICLMVYLMYNKAEVVVNTFCLTILKNTRKMVYNILLTFFQLVFCFATNLAKWRWIWLFWISKMMCSIAKLISLIFFFTVKWVKRLCGINQP
jgi:hypothetical protein